MGCVFRATACWKSARVAWPSHTRARRLLSPRAAHEPCEQRVPLPSHLIHHHPTPVTPHALVAGNPKHNKLYAAYAFYNVPGTFSLAQLLRDALILARNGGVDVFNCLDLMDNGAVLEDLKFGPGDGTLQVRARVVRARIVLPHQRACRTAQYALSHARCCPLFSPSCRPARAVLPLQLAVPGRQARRGWARAALERRGWHKSFQDDGQP